jgi:hypothetical protein
MGFLYECKVKKSEEKKSKAILASIPIPPSLPLPLWDYMGLSKMERRKDSFSIYLLVLNE